MKVEYKTRKCHYYNEDRIFIGKNLFMVMDGATPLVKNGVKPTEASWLVSFVKKRLPLTCENVVGKLKEISISALEQLVEWKFPIDDKYMPSCGISFVNFLGDKIEAQTLGDCEVTFRLKNGEVVRVYQDDLIKLDAIAVEKMEKIAKEKNIPMLEARKEINDILIKHRSYMNKKGGYSVFTPSKTGEFTYSNFVIDKDKVDEIYIYTDGISQSFDELKIYNSHEEMFKKSLNIEKEIKKIEKKAFLDKDCNKYPRFKTIDDIAVIKIKL